MNEEIKNLIETLPEMCFIGPIEDAKIQDAEKELGVTFAKDFVEYTKCYGAISSEKLEWLGVVDSERLSVVKRTNVYRSLYTNFPTNMYVIEDLGIEGTVALQDSTGKIYYFYPYDNDVIFVSDNLCAYLTLKEYSVEQKIRIFPPIDSNVVLKQISYQNQVPSDYFDNARKLIENSIIDLPDNEYCFQVYRENDIGHCKIIGCIWKNKRFEKWS